MSRYLWGLRLIQELLIGSNGKTRVSRNVKFMTLSTDTFFPSKGKGDCEKENISVIIWGFVPQSFPTSPELEYHDCCCLPEKTKNALHILEKTLSLSTTNTSNTENTSYLMEFLIIQKPT